MVLPLLAVLTVGLAFLCLQPWRRPLTVVRRNQPGRGARSVSSLPRQQLRQPARLAVLSLLAGAAAAIECPGPRVGLGYALLVPLVLCCVALFSRRPPEATSAGPLLLRLRCVPHELMVERLPFLVLAVTFTVFAGVSRKCLVICSSGRKRTGLCSGWISSQRLFPGTRPLGLLADAAGSGLHRCQHRRRLRAARRRKRASLTLPTARWKKKPLLFHSHRSPGYGRTQELLNSLEEVSRLFNR
jgi:hypothetical protein